MQKPPLNSRISLSDESEAVAGHPTLRRVSDDMLQSAHARFQHVAAALRQRLGFASAAGRDLDIEQARIRCVIGAGLIAYAVYVLASGEELTPRLRLTMVVACCPLLAGSWLIYWFRQHPQRPASMRYFAICADLIPLTVGLWGADESGVPLLGIYLWVTVGNGFRFGPRYLMFAYWLSALCFLLLLLFVPFWQTHRALGIGIAMILTTIPLYVLVLLSRLTAQKDAALELSNAKSRFVANVSHELRTPLTGVFAVYELLRRRRLPPDERDLIGSLGNAISTLKASVDAILQMSKLEAGAERAELRLFNLRYFLHQVSALVRPQAAAKQLSWSLQIDALVPHTVVGDPSHLQHVIGNLINNALKFTPKGGVSLLVTRKADLVRFEVTDTGIGIPLDRQESLFERFVQADSSATRRFGGTGLGTSIAHDLVELMGGNIGLSSAPGHGSTFWFELPFGDPAEVPLPPWTDLREVLVIGRVGPRRDKIAAMLAGIGLVPVPQEPSLEAPPSFAPNRYLAAILVLPAAEAAAYADAVLRERAGTACPWFVVAGGASVTQIASLLKGGAEGVLSPLLGPDEWHRHLAALATRIALQELEYQAPPIQRKHCVLLADDNQSNQMLLARILENAGHEVVTVARGDEAYDRLGVGGIDLALLDLNMPEMSGPDVIKLFRAGEVGSDRRLPIIILSADATGIAREESLAAGANDYLTKPVTATELLAAIERVMASARPSAESALDRVESEPDRKPESEPEAESAKVVRHSDAPLAFVESERIESLRRIANNDHNFLNQYVEAAFDDIESAIGELRRALKKGNAREARDALHKIDGTSASIGATALLAGAQGMRNYITGSMDSDAASALAELATTCAITKSAVVALLHRMHAGRPQ